MPEDLVPGDVVWVEFDPVLGSEQAGRRPAVVISTLEYNQSIPNVVIVVPATTRDRGLPHHIRLDGPLLRLKSVCFAMVEQPRTIDRKRIHGRAGSVDAQTLAHIRSWLADFLGS